ncbi:hypothetical protein GCM10010392_42060 [Streptomyces clavifer]|nr:hypothetical protein GCM10010392_42060 [Streptomyces clavifer]
MPDALAGSATQNPGSVTSDHTRSTGAAIRVSRSISRSLMRDSFIGALASNSMVAHRFVRRNPKVAFNGRGGVLPRREVLRQVRVRVVPRFRKLRRVAQELGCVRVE